MIQKRFVFQEIASVYLPQVQHIVTNRELSASERKALASYLFEYCREHNPDFAGRWLPAHVDDLIFLTLEDDDFFYKVNLTVSLPFRTRNMLLVKKHDELSELVKDWLDSIQPNKENTRKAIEHLRLVPQNEFSMAIYRFFNIKRPHHPCDSVGCVIGHSTVIDKNVLDYSYEIEHDPDSPCIIFDYHAWSISFFGVNNRKVHEYLFDSDWQDVDNTVESAIKRLELFLEHGNNLMEFVNEQKLQLPW